MRRKVLYSLLVLLFFSCIVLPVIRAEDETESLYNISVKAVDLLNDGCFEESIHYINLLLESDDARLKRAILYEMRAEAYAALGKYEQAADDYRELMLLDQEGKEDHQRLRAWYLLAAGQFIEAQEVYEEIYQSNQQDYLTCFYLGYSYAFTGRQERAREYYREGLSLITNEDQLDIPLFRLTFIEKYDEKLCKKETSWIEEQYQFNYRYYNLADTTYDQAVDLANEKKFLAAADMYARAAEIEKESSEHRLNDLYLALRSAGKYYLIEEQFDPARTIYLEMLKLNEVIGNEYYQVDILAHLGQIYFQQGSYNQALNLLNQSMETIKNHPDELVYEILLPYVSNNIGLIYHSWGDLEEAIKYYQLTLEMANKYNFVIAGYIPITEVNLGVIYQQTGEYDRALEFFNKALPYFQEAGQEHRVAELYDNIGVLMVKMESYNQALDYFEQAQTIYQDINYQAGSIGVTYANMASVYLYQKAPWKAIEYYNKALAIFLEKGMKKEQAQLYNNMGYIYSGLNYNIKASELLLHAIKIIEEIRQSAPDDVQKRTYLQLQIHTYQQLIVIYIRDGQLDQAFNIMEISKARVLAENLASQELNISIPYLEEVRAGLLTGEGMIIFANANREKLVEMVISNKQKSGREVDKIKFITSIREKYGDEIDQMVKRDKRIKSLQSADNDYLLVNQNDYEQFENIIQYYRKLLVEKGQSKDIARALYNLLIKPLEEEITDKNELIIVPDGILNFIPFETLIDEQGNYLVEKYNIRYIQSQTVSELIKARDYPQERGEMMAFGGAVYDLATYDDKGYYLQLIENTIQLANLQQQLDKTLQQRGELSTYYNRLGYGNWKNLPGTVVEIKRIASIIKNAQLVYGDEVSEEKVKDLSRRGELADYKVLHFATHGVVVSEAPELSALVLSQKNKEQLESEEQGGEVKNNQEDGYLRMNEIVKLNIKADFVNLSACETGLGKIYAGEGVVGLTQSFLLAGANSLAVSLWSVADDSTSLFMGELYRLVYQQNLSYNAAINQVKLMFIEGKFGEEYTAPYYWAPFVYYGI